MTIISEVVIIRAMERIEEFLQPTELCDFNTCAAIRDKASQLVRLCADDRQRFQALFEFVRELPYGLEDWDVKASETLRKGWGMCCGKTNLLVAMSRALSIPARYRVFKIRAERRLLRHVLEQNKNVAAQLGNLPPVQDHVQCEAYLSGWRVYDPSRDTAFENGLRKLGIPLERIPVADADGAVHYEIMASIDEWARARQDSRKVREAREAVFAQVNEELERVRRIGRRP
ncbi:MAG: transglutaminase-like domain-containing protein [Dehalococcoidia bacterium]|nr:transglutaminase-like domain-containing protein [Dehalococcoidia bacterium]